ncbi:MAG: hypothetical protein LBI44_00950 [Oscillospiraceae bacterium]|jgi:hypothetical protein|nr:hypothetical protein [Oscillospiraceae bacterium]
MKKLLAFAALAAILAAVLTGCAAKDGKGEKNVEGTVDEILERVYGGLDESAQLPMLMSIPLSEDMGVANDGIRIDYYIGQTGIPFTEGVASEAAIGGAYSVCLLRMADGADIEKAKADIRAGVKPDKWICYTADTVIVDNIGDLVILIMTNNESAPGLGQAIRDSFGKLTE